MSTQRTAFFELLLTLFVTGFLVILAQPLTDVSAVIGLGGRYLSSELAGENAKAQAAMALATDLPQRLAWLAACGWLALRIGRAHLPRVSALALIGAVWAVLWGTQFAPNDDAIWLVGAAGLCMLAFLAQRFLKSAAAAPQAVNAIAYPGWVLFTGLGLIWLVDYSARAYLKWQFLALYQFDSLFIAYVVLSLVAAGGGALTGVLARLLAGFDRAVLPFDVHLPAASEPVHWKRLARKLLPLAVPVVLVVWALVIVVVFGKQRPALTSELLRLPFYVAGGWVVYRWAGQNNSWRMFAGLGLAVFAVAAGLVGTGDFGQVLLVGLGLAVTAGAAVAYLLGGHRLAVLVGALVAASLVAAGLHLVSEYGHWVSTHIGHRAYAVANRFEGKLDYLSELRWFAASTPTGGHGLTQTPWCGTLAHLEEQVRCAGVPREMHSDYVFAGLAGLWGPWAALATTLALALWLLSLVRLPQTHASGNTNALRHAIFASSVVVTLVQLLFTAMGSLGLVVLTGITFPFVAFGGASLLACAAVVGVGLPASQTTHRAKG